LRDGCQQESLCRWRDLEPLPSHPMNVGKNLKRIRKDKGVSQVDLAKAAGVSQQLISQIEGGKNVTTNRLPEIASVLGCEVWDIDPKYTARKVQRSFSRP